MNHNRTNLKKLRGILHRGVLSACLLAPASAILLNPVLHAQVTNGRLSGTVTDSTGAVIPNASVTLTNTINHDIRTTTSNGTGLFSFAGLPSGDYSVSISASGFQRYDETGVHLDPGDSRTLPSVQLQPGSANQTVTVSEDAATIPLDTGERSDLITSEEIKHLAVEGRDVTELFKTLPGFAIAGTGVNNSAYDPSQVNVSGALGNYSANGNPISGVALKLDGANITDPGNYGAAIQNVNYDQVAEVKVQTSNFDAQGSNGPVVVNAVTIAGGDRFHGKLYTYARTSQLDSTDWLSGATGQAKAPDRQVYPGFTIGGPVLIPGTDFNHNRKFTFFAGAEEYAQRNMYAYGNSAGAIVHALVPTANMRQGNFSQAELQKYLGGLYTNPAFTQIATTPTIARDGSPIANGQIAQAYQDPGFQALYKTMPLPNVPTNVNGQYNWVQTNLINDDLWQAIGRGDLAISDRNKLFGRYSVERGHQGVPEVPYYSPGGLNTPGGLLSAFNSESAAASLTTIFNATTTNQLFGAISYLNQSFTVGNQSALNAQALGYPYKGIYGQNGSTEIPQFQTYGAQNGLPLGLFPDMSYGPIFAHKFDPNGGDTLTKLWGNHMAAFGTYVERVTNNQRIPFGTTNGTLQQYYMQTSTYANPNAITDADGSKAFLSENYAANNYEGYTGNFTQQNLLPDTNLYFWNADFFATDAWKIRPRLTVTYGIRFEHLGMWNDAHGLGVAIFDPAQANLPATNTNPQPGFLWHALLSDLPLSGVNSRLLFWEPRVGFAWDISGKGTSVLRGGFGEYRTHDSWNDASNAVTSTQGLHTSQVGGAGVSLRAVSLQNMANNAGGANLSTYALTAGDNQQPLTDTYSLTFNQALPWKINAMLGYVGNNSRYLLNDLSTQTVTLDNVNAIPVGTLFSVPLTGPAGSTTRGNLTAAQINQYRPYPNYGAINVPNHVAYSNYNGLQASATRQAGRFLFNVNYTFGKALGIVSTPVNPFNLRSNYGVEPYDRSQIVNATYTYQVGKPVKNALLGAVTNGWEISGITTFQTGQNMQASTTNPNFGLNGLIGPAGATQYGISNVNFLGTPDVSLQPVLTCDPRSGRTAHQYINGACFAAPAIGQNGPAFFPYLHGPAYFDSDLSGQKSFSMPHDQSLQLRFAAFNFLNHPLTSFTGNFANETTLTLNNTSANATPQTATYDPTSRFGFADYKQGRRVVELSLKYMF